MNFDEKPLQYFNQLKDSDSDTVFVLKHIKAHTPASSRFDNIPDTFSKSTSSTDTAVNLSMSRSTSFPSGGRQPFSVSNSSNSIRSDNSSQAVAIYEYKAIREDELDVMIGDRFIIINRETGWCIVEKGGKRGWVPAGCLHTEDDEEVPSSASTPITAPSSQRVIQGVVLYDYEKISANELSIKKGAVLTIHKKYEHWLLAAWNGKKGWVPSCYVSIEGDEAELDASM